MRTMRTMNACDGGITFQWKCEVRASYTGRLHAVGKEMLQLAKEMYNMKFIYYYV